MEDKILKIVQGFITNSGFIYDKECSKLVSKCGIEEFKVENDIPIFISSEGNE